MSEVECLVFRTGVAHMPGPLSSRQRKVARAMVRLGRFLVDICSLAGLGLWVGCAATPRSEWRSAKGFTESAMVTARAAAPDSGPMGESLVSLHPSELYNQPVEPLHVPQILTEEDLERVGCRDLTLDETVVLALTKSRVLRDLGGTILTNPDRMETKFGPSLIEADPRIGVEAALSEFDARWTTSSNFEKNDRAFNNIFFGGGTRLFQQDLNTFQSQISKTAATGTQYTVRSFTDYNSNNAPGNQFGSAWNSNVELEFRHPLLQRGGVDFNRIAGPRSAPGVIVGVQVARVNSEMSQAEFETGLRDYLSNVANAYWDLYFAYREYDIKRDACQQTREVIAKLDAREKTFPPERKALAYDQLFRLEEEVQNCLMGRALEGTRNNNGAPGGSVRGTGGILVAERRLRLLIGLPLADGQLLRPVEEPCDAQVSFDFQSLVNQAMAERPELKRQRLKVRRRQLELQANRNFLMPQLDASGRYRWRGFGRDLAGDSGGNGQFNSAWSNLVAGNFQEWQLGLEMEVPLGFRRAHVAVHHAELSLARERAILSEQERQVVHDLGSAILEVERAFKVCQTATRRYEQTQELLGVIRQKVDLDRRTTDSQERLLDALRRHADAEARYFLARTELEVAVKNVFFEVGNLPQFLRVATIAPSQAVDPHGSLPSEPTGDPRTVPTQRSGRGEPPARDPRQDSFPAESATESELSPDLLNSETATPEMR